MEEKKKRTKGRTPALSQKISLPYFAEKLRQAITDWKKRTGGTQKELAEACFISQQSLNHYLKGDRWPDDYIIGTLCAEMGISENYFIPEENTLEEYKGSTPRISKHQKNMDKMAAQIGLDSDFVDFLFNNKLITDSDVWRPLMQDDLFAGDGGYFRPELAPTEAAQPGERFIIEREGRQPVQCSRVDLYIMKDLQAAVQKYIRDWYQQRREQMAAQTAEATQQAMQSVKGVVYSHPLSYDELCQIDPYMRYMTVPGRKEGQENGEH